MINLDAIEVSLKYCDLLKSSLFLKTLFDNYFNSKDLDIPLNIYEYIYLDEPDFLTKYFPGIYLFLGLNKYKNGKYKLYFRYMDAIDKNDSGVFFDLELSNSEFKKYMKNDRFRNETYIKKYYVPIELHEEYIMKIQKNEMKMQTPIIQ
jgi:hypothetical protein